MNEKRTHPVVIKIFVNVLVIVLIAFVVYVLYEYFTNAPVSDNNQRQVIRRPEKTLQEITYDNLLAQTIIPMVDLDNYFRNVKGADMLNNSEWNKVLVGFNHLDSIVIIPSIPTLNHQVYLSFKNEDFKFIKKEGGEFDIQNLRLVKIDPNTLAPVVAATYGSKDSIKVWNLRGSTADDFLKPSSNKNPVSDPESTFALYTNLDEDTFYYSQNAYYMFIYEMTIPTAHGTPTDFVFTSSLFKIRSDDQK